MGALIERGGRLVVATHNAGKLAEFEAMLSPLGIALMSAAEAGLAEPEETEATFEGNARLKAEAACDATGLPSLADDSGIMVDALGGAPGVHSARYAGPARDFGDAMRRILDELDAKGAHARTDRGAAFVAVLALARPGAPTVFFEGRTEGRIADAPRGTGGFGYDPLFVPHDGDGRTFGEMAPHEKNGVDAPLAHRARAIAKFRAALAQG